MRKALALRVDDVLLHGTLHTATSGGSVGILFLNSGAQPRCSRGDLNVHLADSLAELGFPCFRFDLPGLGDSQGEAPRDFSEFYRLVQEGAYAGSSAQLVRLLRKEYELSGIVLLGLCGGAMTAVFAAALRPNDGVVGMVLLDLLFAYISSRTKLAEPRPNSSSRLSRARRRVSQCRAGLHDWVLTQRWEPYATAAYRRLKRLSRLGRAGKLPEDANVALLDTLCRLVGQGMPALVVTARPPGPAPLGFDYIAYLTRRCGPGLQHAQIEGTTHSFVENGGAEAVRACVAKFLSRFDHVPAIEKPQLGFHTAKEAEAGFCTIG